MRETPSFEDNKPEVFKSQMTKVVFTRATGDHKLVFLYDKSADVVEAKKEYEKRFGPIDDSISYSVY